MAKKKAPSKKAPAKFTRKANIQASADTSKATKPGGKPAPRKK